MIDIVERLRAEGAGLPATYIKNAAADEIERLRAVAQEAPNTDALRVALGKAWIRYVELFGDQPHGTTKQLDVLVALFPVAEPVSDSTLKTAMREDK